MTNAELLMKMANNEILTGNEIIASQTFTSADGKHTATAQISVLHDVSKDGKLGEIVNGGCDVTTDGGIVYHADTYRGAINMAKALVAHWDAGDYDWEPKQAQW